MQWRKHSRAVIFYLLIQIIIWVKVFFFFQWFGFGAVSEHSEQFFTEEQKLFDLAFHQSMHLLIAISAFTLGKKLGKINDRELVSIVLVAVVLHNIGYWFTRVFETIAGALIDFVTDAVMLYTFTITSSYLAKKYAFFRNIKFPLLH